MLLPLVMDHWQRTIITANGANSKSHAIEFISVALGQMMRLQLSIICMPQLQPLCSTALVPKNLTTSKILSPLPMLKKPGQA